MKKENDTSIIPSKKSIIKAWIILIILSLCLSGLIYTKKTYKPKEEINEEVTLPATVVEALNNIVSNFNNNKDITELKEKNEIYVSTLEGKYIIINYTKDENVTEIRYEYDLIKHTLSSSSTNVDKVVFENIFKFLVSSCQERLENTNDVASYIDKFLEGESVYGLSKEADVYSIDIIVKLGDIPNIQQENTENNNTETNNLVPAEENTEENVSE